MKLTEEQIKHLEFTQNVITRMNSNSFQIKGWAITVVSAFLALYASNKNEVYIFIAIIPTILFGLLDTYYLQLERKFRLIYHNIIDPAINVTPFNMSLDQLNNNKMNEETTFFSVMKSPSILYLYLSICILLLLGGLILKYKECIISFIN